MSAIPSKLIMETEDQTNELFAIVLSLKEGIVPFERKYAIN